MDFQCLYRLRWWPTNFSCPNYVSNFILDRHACQALCWVYCFHQSFGSNMITIAHGMSRQIIANLSVMSVKLSWRSNPVRRSLEFSVTFGLGGVLNLPSPHACLGELLGRGVANAAVRTNIPPNNSNSPAVAMMARANTLTLLFYPQQLSSSIFMPCAAMLVYRIMPWGYNSSEDSLTSSHPSP